MSFIAEKIDEELSRYAFGSEEENYSGWIFQPNQNEWLKIEPFGDAVAINWSTTLIDSDAAISFLDSLIIDQSGWEGLVAEENDKESYKFSSLEELKDKKILFLQFFSDDDAFQWRITWEGIAQFGWLGDRDTVWHAIDLLDSTSTEQIKKIQPRINELLESLEIQVNPN